MIDSSQYFMHQMLIHQVRHELNWHQGVVYPMRDWSQEDIVLLRYLVWKERFLSTKAVYMYLLHSLLPGTTPNLSWHIYKEYNARNFGYFLWLNFSTYEIERRESLFAQFIILSMAKKKSVQSGACSHLIAFIALTGLPIIASIQFLIKKKNQKITTNTDGIYIPT